MAMELGTRMRRRAVAANEQAPVAALAAVDAKTAAAVAVKTAEAARKDAAAADKAASAELDAVRREVSGWLDDGEARLRAALAAAEVDPYAALAARGPAREALYGGGSLLDGMAALARTDGHTAALLDVWQRTGVIMRDVGTGFLELAEADPVVQRADRLECAAWLALLTRVSVCAGEA